MRFNVKITNLTESLRKSGYHPEVKRRTGEMSFVRSVGLRPFPRFHVYGQKAGGGFELNLHLDQKQPSYEGTSAHAGEYEGEIIEKDSARIKTLLEQAEPAVNISKDFLE